MKLFLLSITMLAVMSCAGQQTSTDTVCIRESSLRKLLTAAEQKKALEQQVELVNSRLQIQQDLTKQWRDKYVMDSVSHSREAVLHDERNKAVLQSVAQLNKQLRWQKLKGGLFGGGMAAAVVFILVKSFVK